MRLRPFRAESPLRMKMTGKRPQASFLLKPPRRIPEQHSLPALRPLPLPFLLLSRPRPMRRSPRARQRKRSIPKPHRPMIRPFLRLHRPQQLQLLPQIPAFPQRLRLPARARARLLPRFLLRPSPRLPRLPIPSPLTAIFQLGKRPASSISSTVLKMITFRTIS